MSSKLEALLFIYGEPIPMKKVATILGISAEEAATAVAELKKALADQARGIAVLEYQGAVQLVTKPDYAELLGSVLKQELNESLTAAALETLAIIAYAGPVSRADIDYIRGVNSSFTVRALLLRGLITRTPDPTRGNSFMYAVSNECILHLGLEDLRQLPEFEKFSALAKTLRQPVASAAPAEMAPPTP
jgi:segregation and condensation protein B